MEREELEAILKRIKSLGELAADRLGIIRLKDSELATLRAENEKLREALVEMITYSHETRGFRAVDALNKAKEALK